MITTEQGTAQAASTSISTSLAGGKSPNTSNTPPDPLSDTTTQMYGTIDGSNTTLLITTASLSPDTSTSSIVDTSTQSFIETSTQTKLSVTENTTIETFTKTRPMAVQTTDTTEAPLVISMEPTSYSVSTRSSKALSLDDFLPPELRQDPTTTTNSYITVEPTTSSVTTSSSTTTSTTTTTSTSTKTTKEKGESNSEKTEKQGDRELT